MCIHLVLTCVKRGFVGSVLFETLSLFISGYCFLAAREQSLRSHFEVVQAVCYAGGSAASQAWHVLLRPPRAVKPFG